MRQLFDYEVTKISKMADLIADRLMTDATGLKVDRLVLMMDGQPGADRGIYSQSALARQIERLLIQAERDWGAGEP